MQERLIPVPYSKNTTDQAVSSSCFHFPFLPEKKNENEGKNRKKDASACGIFFSLFILFFTYLDLDLKLLDLPVSSSRSMKLFLVA